MATAPQSKTTGKRQAPAADQRRKTGRSAVPIPVVTPHVKFYRVSVPGVDTVVGAGRSAASHLPPPERVAFYGGLGAMATFGVISWPVATAIGVGTVIARRARRQDPDKGESAGSQKDAGGEPAKQRATGVRSR